MTHLSSEQFLVLYLGASSQYPANRLRVLRVQERDSCLLDMFISAVRFMAGGPKTPWWKFTAERKKT